MPISAIIQQVFPYINSLEKKHNRQSMQTFNCELFLLRITGNCSILCFFKLKMFWQLTSFLKDEMNNALRVMIS